MLPHDTVSRRTAHEHVQRGPERSCEPAPVDHLWKYKTREGLARFLEGWRRAPRWQRLPEMKKLGEFLVRRLDGIAAYCDHPVRFGVVESLNTTIKAILRRARGITFDTIGISGGDRIGLGARPPRKNDPREGGAPAMSFGKEASQW